MTTPFKPEPEWLEQVQEFYALVDRVRGVHPTATNPDALALVAWLAAAPVGWLRANALFVLLHDPVAWEAATLAGGDGWVGIMAPLKGWLDAVPWREDQTNDPRRYRGRWLRDPATGRWTHHLRRGGHTTPVDIDATDWKFLYAEAVKP